MKLKDLLENFDYTNNVADIVINCRDGYEIEHIIAVEVIADNSRIQQYADREVLSWYVDIEECSNTCGFDITYNQILNIRLDTM